MRKVLFGLGILLSVGLFCACSSDDELLNGNEEKKGGELDSWFNDTDKKSISDPNSIIGTWELHIISDLTTDTDVELSLGQGDLYMFNSNGKVKAVKRTKYLPEFPGEDGEYDYSYDKEKQVLQLCGITWHCVISGGEMYIDARTGGGAL